MTTATRGPPGGGRRHGAPTSSPRTSGTGVPRATGRRPRPGTGRPVSSPHDGHVAQFASRTGPLAIQVDVGPGHRQGVGQPGVGPGTVGRPEDVDAGHGGRRRAVDPRGRSRTARRWFSNCEVTDALDRPVPRVVGPGGDLVDQAAPRRSRRARRPGPRATRPPRPPGARARRPPRPGPRRSSRAGHQHLPADPVDLGGLHRRPHRRRAARAAGPPARPARRPGAPSSSTSIGVPLAAAPASTASAPARGRSTGQTPRPS